jgi:hypothetical protein
VRFDEISANAAVLIRAMQQKAATANSGTGRAGRNDLRNRKRNLPIPTPFSRQKKSPQRAIPLVDAGGHKSQQDDYDGLWA